jgi:hypothetical protein
MTGIYDDLVILLRHSRTALPSDACLQHYFRHSVSKSKPLLGSTFLAECGRLCGLYYCKRGGRAYVGLVTAT